MIKKDYLSHLNCTFGQRRRGWKCHSLQPTLGRLLRSRFERRSQIVDESSHVCPAIMSDGLDDRRAARRILISCTSGAAPWYAVAVTFGGKT